MTTPSSPLVQGRRSALLLILATLMVLATSCSTSVPSTTSSSTTEKSETSTTKATSVEPIDWKDCDDAPSPFECATIEVPVDHDAPDGKTLDLALVKRPADDQADKIGPLLVNPGGPGGSGIDLVENNLWAPAITKNFDVIGFDPRGVGASTPIDCDFDVAELYSVDPAPQTPRAVAKLEAVSKKYVQSCADHDELGLLEHMGTRDVVDDMDTIRARLGADKLNYLGYSYGTSIGQVYADTYPENIRAMVLDGVVRLGQPGIEASSDQGVAFDKVLETFFAACKDQDACPIEGDPATTFSEIRQQIRKKPLPTSDGDRVLDSGMFQLGVGQALYAQFLWPQLATGLSDAAEGDGTALLQLADQYLGRQPDGTYDNQTDAYFAVSCLDWDWPDKPAAFIEAGRDIAKTSPFLAEGTINDYIRCAYWPTPPQPLTPPKAEGSPLIVVISTTEDPATPYANGVDLADELPEAALITKVGTKHTAYGDGSACVDGAVNDYLVSLKAPKPDLRCS